LAGFSTDVDNKIDVLKRHRKGKHAKEYDTVQDMIAYEVQNNLIRPKAKDSGTGTRNLLRLHRALEFIIVFLKGVPDLAIHDKCSVLSKDAYKKTLMKYHPWFIQKAALLAMEVLPNKKRLIEKVNRKELKSDECKAFENLLSLCVKVMEEVYSKTNEVYGYYKLLNLP